MSLVSRFVNIGSQGYERPVCIYSCQTNQRASRPEQCGRHRDHSRNRYHGGETAYFLNLTVKSDKPVVLTRRHASLNGDEGADGPLNLYNSVVTAADPSSKRERRYDCDERSYPRRAFHAKMNTTDVQTFRGSRCGPLGYVYNSKPYCNMQTLKKHTTESVFDVTNLTSLPQSRNCLCIFQRCEARCNESFPYQRVSESDPRRSQQQQPITRTYSLNFSKPASSA